MPSIISFSEALDRSSTGKRRLLLGNGFSIACRPEIFSYNALFDQARFDEGHIARRAFDVLSTTDFEEVMKALRDASRLLRAHNADLGPIADEFAAAVVELRRILVETIAGQHPAHPSEISDDRYRACRMFLSNFESVYTLNYDLLLYWAIMRSELGLSVPLDDGFRTPDEREATYVTWEIEKTDQQDVFYLHGALHIFDAGPELQKYTWVNTGIRLIEQIRAALENDLFPLIVAEGTADQKKAKVTHSSYLSRGLRSLAHLGGSLFVFGHSLAERDEHVLRMIDRSKLSTIFIGIYGSPNSSANKRIVERAQRFASRKGRSVAFYDSESARVWG